MAIVLAMPMATVPTADTEPTVKTDRLAESVAGALPHETDVAMEPTFQTVAPPPGATPLEVTPSVVEPPETTPPETTSSVATPSVASSPPQEPGNIGPQVLILHSHTSESYETPHTLSRSGWDYHVPNETDTGITRVGAAIAEGLERLGIGVVHSTDVHNYPVHADAYARSRATVKDVLARFPTIQMVLDVHRQGIPNMNWTTTINGMSAVKVELIYTVDQALPPALAMAPSASGAGEGADQAGHSGEAGGHGQGQLHGDGGEAPLSGTTVDQADAGNDERSNRAFAHMFAERLNATYPGMLHKVTTVAGNRYNQDLFPNMLLLEVGNHLDMEADAITTGTLLADVIAQLLSELGD